MKNLYPDELFIRIPDLFPLTKESLEKWKKLAEENPEFEVLFPLKGSNMAIEHIHAITDVVKLRSDPSNKFDKHAVKVLNQDGTFLGWLPAGCGWPHTAKAEVVSIGAQGQGKEKYQEWDYFDYTWLRPIYPKK